VAWFAHVVQCAGQTRWVPVGASIIRPRVGLARYFLSPGILGLEGIVSRVLSLFPFANSRARFVKWQPDWHELGRGDNDQHERPWRRGTATHKQAGLGSAGRFFSRYPGGCRRRRRRMDAAAPCSRSLGSRSLSRACAVKRETTRQREVLPMYPVQRPPVQRPAPSPE